VQLDPGRERLVEWCGGVPRLPVAGACGCRALRVQAQFEHRMQVLVGEHAPAELSGESLHVVRAETVRLQSLLEFPLSVKTEHDARLTGKQKLKWNTVSIGQCGDRSLNLG
jgi:hypothetical protein